MLSAALTSSTPAAADPVRQAITQASRATGIPFDYLLRTAQRESNLDPAARAPTSTAAGLFQFLDQTWLGVVREAGAQHGLAREAGQIERRADGRYAVADPAERQRILDMRLDPAANAVMAGVFTQRNGAELTQALGREPSQGELYMAHFLGAGGASRFLTEASRTPDAPAATQFPDAARANRPIFYARDGRALSFAEVRERLVARHEGQAGTQAVAEVQAAARVSATEAALAAGAEARAVPQARTAPGGPVFHSMFQVEGRGAVAPVVQALWGRAPGVPGTAPAARPGFFPTSGSRLAILPPEGAPPSLAAAPDAATAAAIVAAPAATQPLVVAPAAAQPLAVAPAARPVAAVPASPALGAVPRAARVEAPLREAAVEPPQAAPARAPARQEAAAPVRRAQPIARPPERPPTPTPLDLLSFARRAAQ